MVVSKWCEWVNKWMIGVTGSEWPGIGWLNLNMVEGRSGWVLTYLESYASVMEVMEVFQSG